MVCDWIKTQELTLTGKDAAPLGQRELVLQREGNRLVIRLVSHSDQIILLLEEHSPTMHVGPLATSPLSPREAQVLGWVSQGKTNKEVGLILKLSARTVQKHLEHIYQKMGVENRTGASAKTHEVRR